MKPLTPAQKEEYINHIRNPLRNPFFERFALNQETILELGSGWSAPNMDDYSGIFIPLDLSVKSLKGQKEKNPQFQPVAANASYLPFLSDSIGVVCTNRMMEHIHDPEKVIKEIIRVCQPEGHIFLNDAWNVPTWAPSGILSLKWEKANWSEKIRILFYGLRQKYFIRIPLRIMFRLLREFRYILKRPNWNFEYRRLTPNYDLYLLSDEDAAASIDSHSVILYFRQLGYESISHQGFKRRVFHSSRQALTFRKPLTT